MDDLIAFITARLDEDEAAAKRNIRRGPGEWDGLGDAEGAVPSWPDYQTFDGPDLDAANAYIGRFRPLRMLREVAAKRAIMAEHKPYDCLEPKGQRCDRCASDRAYRSGAAIHEAWPCPTLRHLAAIWSDHPDYRAE